MKLSTAESNSPTIVVHTSNRFNDLESSTIQDINVIESPEVIVTTPQSAPPVLQVEVETIPSDLGRLIQRSISENDFSHLIKDSLKRKIQDKRLEDGKTPLKVEFEEPRKYELTEEEKRKIERRKNRNRQSAKVSREKRKQREETLEQLVEELEADQIKLREEVKMFSSMEKNMRDKFSDHMIRCANKGKAMRTAGLLGRSGFVIGQKVNVSTCPKVSTMCVAPVSLGPASSYTMAPQRLPVMETPAPQRLPVIETPAPQRPPVMETPAPQRPPVMETPAPQRLPVMETPAPQRLHVMENPAPQRLPVMEVVVDHNSSDNLQSNQQLAAKIRQLEMLSKLIRGKDVPLNRPAPRTSGNGPGNPQLPIYVD